MHFQQTEISTVLFCSGVLSHPLFRIIGCELINNIYQHKSKVKKIGIPHPNFNALSAASQEVTYPSVYPLGEIRKSSLLRLS